MRRRHVATAGPAGMGKSPAYDNGYAISDRVAMAFEVPNTRPAHRNFAASPSNTAELSRMPAGIDSPSAAQLIGPMVGAFGTRIVPVPIAMRDLASPSGPGAAHEEYSGRSS